MSDMAETTENTEAEQSNVLPQHRGLRPYQPGQSGNPAGRPKGARSKLTGDFIADLHEVWVEQGKAILSKLAVDKPEVLFNGVVKLMPRQINLSDDREVMNGEQRAARLLGALRTLHQTGALLPILERLGSAGSGDAAGTEVGGAGQIIDVQAVS